MEKSKMAAKKTPKVSKKNDDAPARDNNGGVKGIDRTQKENVPDGFEHSGDGSPEKPHNVSPVSRW